MGLESIIAACIAGLASGASEVLGAKAMESATELVRKAAMRLGKDPAGLTQGDAQDIADTIQEMASKNPEVAKKLARLQKRASGTQAGARPKLKQSNRVFGILVNSSVTQSNKTGF